MKKEDTETDDESKAKVCWLCEQGVARGAYTGNHSYAMSGVGFVTTSCPSTYDDCESAKRELKVAVMRPAFYGSSILSPGTMNTDSRPRGPPAVVVHDETTIADTRVAPRLGLG